MSFLFKNILVINLDKDKKRLNTLKKSLDELNLTFTRIPAILGKDLPRLVIEKYLPRLTTVGAIGCAFSHKKAWKYMIDNNLPYALILEDDATPVHVLVKKILNGSMKLDIPDNWDFIYLGHAKAEWPRNVGSTIPQPPYDIDGENGPITVSKYVIKFVDEHQAPMGGWSYALKLETAHAYYKLYQLQRYVDRFFILQSTLNNYNVYGIVPIPIVHAYEHGSHTVENSYIPNIYKSKKETSKVITFYVCLVLVVLLLLIKNKIPFELFLFLMMIVIVIAVVSLYFVKQNEDYNTAFKKFKKNLPGTWGVHHFDPFGSVWTEKSKKRLRTLLSEFINLCENMEPPIKVVLCYGSLLGWARHNKQIIPWDDDVDVVVSEEDGQRLLKELKEQDLFGFNQDNPNAYFFKIWFKDEKKSDKIQGYNQRYPFIDIYCYNNEMKCTINDKKLVNIPKSEASDPTPMLLKTDFESVPVYVPEDYHTILSNLFPEWERKCVSSSWNHRTEKPIEKKYREEILCRDIL